MWWSIALQAAMVVVLFLAIAASLVALAISRNRTAPLVGPGDEPEPPAGPPWWATWLAQTFPRYFVLSSRDDYSVDDAPVAEAATTPTTIADNRIAMRDNRDNALVTGNADNAAATFQGRVEALAILIAAGKVGQAEGIELVFHCSRSSRPESVYQRARAALRTLEAAPYRPLTPEQQLLRDELGLSRR